MSAIIRVVSGSLFCIFAIIGVSFNTKAATTENAFDTLRGGALMDQVVEVPYKGDLSPLIRKKIIRILVSPSRANFLVSKGHLAGFEFELTQRYRNYLKTRVRRRSWPVAFIYIPTPFNKLLGELEAGHGDVVAAGLTKTSEREKIAAFTDPYIENVREILVTWKNADTIQQEEDLSGKSLLVMEGTSYIKSLEILNVRLEKKGLKPALIRIENEGSITTEDILEMLNSGIIDYTVADHHLADLWSQVLPNIRLQKTITLNKGGEIAWAVRKGNLELLQSLNRFLKQNRKGTLTGNILFNRYFKGHHWISNPLKNNQIGKLDKLRDLFKKYGEKYDFDWKFLAAVAYQESQLNQNALSPGGAVGLMQVLPETAAYEAINIPNIDTAEGNIHAGTKYLAYLRDKFFKDEGISDSDRLKLILASYNAGPGRVKKLRATTRKRGLDPNKWFSNVALEARRSIGFETVDYVAKVAKYYVAYRLLSEDTKERSKTINTLKKTGKGTK